MPKLFVRRFSVITSLGLLLGMLFSGAIAGAEAKSNFDFEACVESQRAASVLLMMDESGSIYADATRSKDKAGSDPDNLRITGAEILFNSLQKVSSGYDTDIKVMLAGFGDDFRQRSGGTGGWIDIEPDAPQKGLTQLVNQAREWAKKPGDKNYRETDMLSALAGAQKALDSQPKESCKLFVFFKDGVDFQHFYEKNPSPIPGYSEIYKELGKETSSSYKTATKMAIDEICRPGGLADALRIDPNIYTLGVAISPDGNAKGLAPFKSVVEGGRSAECQGGSKPAKGEILVAENVNRLPFLFQSALSPSWRPNEVSGNFSLKVVTAVSGVTVLSSGIPSVFNSFRISPPSATCGAPVVIQKGQNQTDEAVFPGVSLSVVWLGLPGQNKTLSLELARTSDESSCWVGTWNVEPGDTTSSSYSYSVDLQAVANFDADQLVLQGGAGSSSKQYSIVLQRPSSGARVEFADAIDGADLTVTGELREATSKEHVNSDWDQRVLRNEEIGKPLAFSAVNLKNGEYELVLNLDVQLSSVYGSMKPKTTQRPITVRSKFLAPTPSRGSILNFGLISGGDPVSQTLYVDGNPEVDFELSSSSLSDSVSLSQFPAGVTYKVALAPSMGNLVLIKRGALKQPIEVVLTPIGDKGDKLIKANGLVRGQITLFTTARAANEANPTPIVFDFKAEQKASVNSGMQIIYITAFFILGVLLTLGAVILITWIVGRYPSEKFMAKNGMLPRSSIENVNFGAEGVRFDQSIEDAFSRDEKFVLAEVTRNRRSAFLSKQEFKVKTHGLSLKDVGHGQVHDKALVGFSSEDPSRPLIPLSLASGWVFLTSEKDYRNAKKGLPASGTLIVLSSNPDDTRLASLRTDFQGDFDSKLNSALESVPEEEPDEVVEEAAVKEDFIAILKSKSKTSADVPPRPIDDPDEW